MYNLSEKAIAEKYEDLLFTKVMALYAAEESEKILSEIESEEPADPKNIEKIYSKTERRENFSNLWKVSKKLITFAAMVVFVAVVSLSSVVVASAEAREAVAEAIYHLVLRKTDRYTEVSIGNSTGFIDPEIYTWNDAYAPTYMAEGFELSNFSCTSSQQTVDYVCGEDFINFIQARKSTGQIDTENADITKEIQIGESKGFLVVKDDWSCVTCSIEDILIQVSGTAPTEEIIKIAESLKPIGKTETEEPAEEYKFVDPEIYDWDNAYGMTYVPENFIFINSDDLGSSQFLNYRNGEKVLSFIQSTDTSSFVDSENADSIKNIIIGTSEALLITKSDWSCISWTLGNKLLQLSGNVSTEEIIKVAEGIKPIGKTATEEPTEECEFIDAEFFNWEGAFAPTYIPKGFEISDIDIAPDSPAITYSKGKQFFVIYQLTEGAKARIDSENADVYKTIFINGNEGLFIKKADEISITWNDGNIFFWLFGTISEKEFLKVAEGLKPLGKTKTEEPAEEYEFVDPEIYDWEGAYAPTYMAFGYVFSELKESPSTKLSVYNNNDKYVSFSQSYEGVFQVDTEDADVVKEIIINDNNAIYIEKNGFVIIVWNIEKNTFSIRGTIEPDEAIKIAEGIKPMN